MNFVYLFLFLMMSSCGAAVVDDELTSPREKRRTNNADAKSRGDDATGNKLPEEDKPVNDTKSYVIVGLREQDISSVVSCIYQFDPFPFPERITNYHRSVPLKGEGNIVVEEKLTSDEDRFVLIDTFQVEGGNYEFNLNSDRSYYCIKPLEGDIDKLTINTNCENQIVFADAESSNSKVIDISQKLMVIRKNQDGSGCSTHK